VIGVEKENDACSFIEKWMKIFKIGDSFIIKSIYNEAFTVDIIDNNGKTKSLGYLGTGSIQLFILLLNIAMAIAFNRKIMLSIEEPEQNLHPALQSRLAEMFYEVWKNTDGKVEFLVETHSEYLVRQTQVIAAKAIDNGEYTTDEVNDIFKVYYFPEEGLPYSMNYRQNGYFEKPFGTGFYDASGNLSRELYKIDRRL
jgi:predicted ATPase